MVTLVNVVGFVSLYYENIAEILYQPLRNIEQFFPLKLYSANSTPHLDEQFLHISL